MYPTSASSQVAKHDTSPVFDDVSYPSSRAVWNRHTRLVSTNGNVVHSLERRPSRSCPQIHF